MRGGRVFGLLMPGHHINDSESLLLPTTTATYGGTSAKSHLERKPGRTKVTDLRMVTEEGLLQSGGRLLPTPIVSDGTGGSKDINASDFSPQMRDITKLLPTPNTMDHLPARTAEQKAANAGKGGYANVRETVVNDLMPTPKALDGEKGNLKSSQERIDSGHQVDLPNIAIDLVDIPQTNWGKFGPAIHRWEETVGRAAPAPTKPDGKDGAHRLSSKFTEWMMGLDDGWITDVGLSRNDELKACGNGVVPQQALLALHSLLDGVTVERERERAL